MGCQKPYKADSYHKQAPSRCDECGETIMQRIERAGDGMYENPEIQTIYKEEEPELSDFLDIMSDINKIDLLKNLEIIYNSAPRRPSLV